MSDPPTGAQYVDAPEDYDGPNMWMNHSGYRIMVGPGRSPFFLNDVAQRINNELPVIIMVSGPPGTGKSYWGVRLAEMLDPLFDVTTNVPMDRAHFLELIGPGSPLDRGSVIVSDEAQFLMSARRWFEETQKDLMDQVESIRSLGLIIIIVALHIELMDVVVRKHILNYYVYLEKPGLATVYNLYTGRFDRENKYYRLGQTNLLLPGYEECTDPGCLTCKYSGLRKNIWRQRDNWEKIGFNPCYNMRAVYERLKRHKLDLINIASLEKLKVKEKEPIPPDKKCIDSVHDNIENHILTTHGRLDLNYMQLLLEEKYGMEFTLHNVRRIRVGYERKYPKSSPKDRKKQ